MTKPVEGVSEKIMADLKSVGISYYLELIKPLCLLLPVQELPVLSC